MILNLNKLFFLKLKLQMRRFEEELKMKAHISKIKQAKKTITSSGRIVSRLGNSKIRDQAQLLLQLYEKNSYNSIPVYKLLHRVSLQQYSKEFILRGYGVNINKLTLLSEQERKTLYEQIKVMPGHTFKLDKLIEEMSLSNQQSSFETPWNKSSRIPLSEKPRFMGTLQHNQQKEFQQELLKVIKQYTPSQQKISQPQMNLTSKGIFAQQTPNSHFLKNSESKKTRQRTTQFKKKEQVSLKHKKSSLKEIKIQQRKWTIEQVMDLKLDLQKAKALDRSFDGALMSSTVANIDIQQLVVAFASFVSAQIIAAEQQPSVSKKQQTGQNIQDIADILRESYLHPLYRQGVQQQIDCEQTHSQQQLVQQIQTQQKQNEFSFQNDKMIQSSFMGSQSIQFGVPPLMIFCEPQPSEIDYLCPSIDSISNFIKNVVLAAKMEREVPILAAVYFEDFLVKAALALTSLNYKRLLVTCLLLASKIWDDESFETPSFSKTFPQYSTHLLNEMEKQVVKTLDYKLKVDKKQYTRMYFRLRAFNKNYARSYYNRKMTISKIRDMQMNKRTVFKSNYMGKRNSY